MSRLRLPAAVLATALIAWPACAGELTDLMADADTHTHNGSICLDQWKQSAQAGDTGNACTELEDARVELDAAYHDVEAIRSLAENGGDLEGNARQDVLDFVTNQEDVASEEGSHMADYYDAYCAP